MFAVVCLLFVCQLTYTRQQLQQLGHQLAGQVQLMQLRETGHQLARVRGKYFGN